MIFETEYQRILECLDRIDPQRYGSTRNFKDGAVTRLSPYVSRGVISTREIFQFLLEKGYAISEMEKFVQELAWRDYWQQVWLSKGDLIEHDLKSIQQKVIHRQIPVNILQAQTGIVAIDQAIKQLYDTGYMHNHMRMYVASLACNVAGSHWYMPAQWMYYYLLDADWASNALSWQWVAGTNSHKKYFANQDNINKYFYSDQKGTYLDIPYAQFDSIRVPEVLAETDTLRLPTNLPKTATLVTDASKPILIYNFYNLDPLWRKEEDVNRILLLEPSHFERYPVSDLSIDFAIKLSQNIPGIQIFVGEFSELCKLTGSKNFYFKEHPFFRYYEGIQDDRDWMFSVQGYFSSFFAFWKRCVGSVKI